MAEPLIAAVGVVLAALIAGLFGASWLNRRNLARLTAAQASQSNASSTEITDRIAREWLNRLDIRVTAAENELDHERRIRRGAVAYIERLLDWISTRHPEGAADLPAPPAELLDYLLDV